MLVYDTVGWVCILLGQQSNTLIFQEVINFAKVLTRTVLFAPKQIKEQQKDPTKYIYLPQSMSLSLLQQPHSEHQGSPRQNCFKHKELNAKKLQLVKPWLIWGCWKFPGWSVVLPVGGFWAVLLTTWGIICNPLEAMI